MFPVSHSSYPKDLPRNPPSGSKPDWLIFSIAHLAMATLARVLTQLHKRKEQNALEQSFRAWEKSTPGEVESKEKAINAVRQIGSNAQSEPVDLFKQDSSLPFTLNIAGLKLPTLPPIPNCDKLQVVYASSNSFSRFPPLAPFSSLVHLDVSNCALISFPSISSLPLLRFVNASSNLLTEIPEVDEQSHPRLVLDLNKNHIETLSEDLEKRATSQRIHLQGNPLSRASYFRILQLISEGLGPKIEANRLQPSDNGKISVDLQNMEIAEVPEYFYKIGNTYVLDLRNNPITEKDRKNIADHLQIKKYHDPKRIQIKINKMKPSIEAPSL